MKIFIFTAILFLFGCSHEDKEEINNNEELVGSCWHQKIDSYQSYTFYFAINGKCTREWETGLGKPVSTEYKYSYNPPNIKINMLNGGIFATGYIENNTMYLDGGHIEYILDKVR